MNYVLAAIAPLPQPPDSPFKDLLGWLVVFFVVIWPIIRGVIASATEQRKKFEATQRRAGHRTPQAKVPGRTRLDAFIEDMVSGQRAQHGEGSQLPDELPTAEFPMAAATTVIEAPPPVPRRPKSRPAAEVAAEPDPHLSADPFDDSLLTRPLVDADAIFGVPDDHQAESEAPLAIDRLALSEVQQKMTVTGRHKESALVRINRGRTPWQAAFLLKEILGPPGGARGTGNPYH